MYSEGRIGKHGGMTLRSFDCDPGRMTPSTMRRLAAAVLVLWVACVAYLTLTPSGHTPPLTLRGFFCVACGELDGSDMLRNWILFVPGGLVAAIVFPGWRGLAIPLGLTALVEFVQVGVPGRDPAASDLILNGLGAVTGLLIAARGLAPWGRRLLAASAAIAWLAPIVLLIPTTTPQDLYGLWTPRFGNRAHYDGQVLAAEVGTLSIPSRLVPERAELVAALEDRGPVRLLLEVGTDPQFAIAPVFQVKDLQTRDLFELLALHSDLLLRGRNPARVLKLDQPDVRWHGAMAGLTPGDTVTLVVDRGRGSVCMSIDDRERCELAPSLGDGWAFVLNLEGPPRWFRELMSVAWALGLGGLIGLTTRSPQSAVALTTALALLGYFGAVISPDVRPDVVHAVVLVAGGLAGALLRAPVVSIWKTVRPT